MAIPCTIQEREYAAFCETPDGDTAKRTCAPASEALLQEIIDALSGRTQEFNKKIDNVAIAAANTEQSLVMETNIAGYMIKVRDGLADLKISHNSGESGSNFLSIPKCSVHTDDHQFKDLTIYFQSPTVGAIVEVVSWY